MGMFYLLTLYAAIRAMQSKRLAGWSIVSMICCGIGMASKEVMVTAPVLVLFYDRVFIARSFVSALRRRWGLYSGLGVTWIILIVLMWSGPRSETTGFGMENIGVWTYLASQFGVIVHYLGLCIWPAGLCLDYGWPVAKTLGDIVPPMVVILCILSVVVWGLICNRIWSYPFIWFFGILAPTSSFVPIADLAFEHRLYLPLAGPIVLTVIAGYLLLVSAAGHVSLSKKTFERWVGGILVIVIIVVLMAVTVRRNDEYRSVESIWRTVLARAPQTPRAYNVLGGVLSERGELDEAISYYRKALQIRPNYAAAYNNLGVVFESQGKINDAANCFRQALQLDSDYADAHNSLGNILASEGRFAQAVNHYRKVLQIRPYYAEAHYNLARVLQSQGLHDEAISSYRRALSFNPDYAEAHNNLGNAFRAKGDLKRAIRHFQQSVQSKPDFAEAHYNLANSFKLQGRFDEAITHYRQSIELQPADADMYNNLANTLRLKGEIDEAIDFYQKSLQTDPDYVPARNNLGIVLFSEGRHDEALEHFRYIVRLEPDSASALNFISRILIEHPDFKQRDVHLALNSAQRAVQLTNYQNATILQTLAAAYAAGGQFDKAIETARKALALAVANQNRELADRIRRQLQSYNDRQP
jgi:tetratricopeptide (TPR) repeat protein